jgi:hypothetical protein
VVRDSLVYLGLRYRQTINLCELSGDSAEGNGISLDIPERMDRR